MPRFAFPAFCAILFLLLQGGCRLREVPTGGGDGMAVGLAVPGSFQETVVAEMNLPTTMAFAPDGRIFVCQQEGAVRVIKDGALLPTPFVTVNGNEEGERGLLGIAFDPQFATTHPYVYLYYTSGSPYHNKVSRFTASSSNPDVADAGSEVVLFDLPGLSATNHNGGAIHFGPDGKLYIATGENAVNSNSQSHSTVLGKILRIDKEYSGTPGVPSIPADNPFYSANSGNNRAIWALGLRNPFNFSFQPGTGRMHINDVGWMEWEEVNLGEAGANYGWPTVEGDQDDPRFTRPHYAYPNTRNTSVAGQGCAIVGSAFYNPANATFPADYAGDYFFGDYCEGWIRRLDVATGAVTEFADGIEGIVDIKVGDDGSLYYLSRTSGELVRVSPSGSQAPSVSRHPAAVTVPVGASATFSVTASGAAPLSYRWQRGGSDIPGATSSSYTLSDAQASDSGAVFRCVVANAHGEDVSDGAVLHVTVNKAPTAAITAPDTSLRFSAGDTLAYSGTGADPEDGALAGAAFTWRVDLHHDTHEHPFLAATSGSTGGTVVVPRVGETSDNVWLRFHLTVRDSKGLTHQVQRDIHPRKARITLATQPAGLQVMLDGQPFTAPYTVTGVTGMERSLEVDGTQQLGGRNYRFVSWSDGGGNPHDIRFPGQDADYTAVFREDSSTNTSPTAVIVSPAADLLYEGGMSLSYSATGTDAEDGDLPEGAFTWRASLYHDGHTHVLLPATTGARSGTVTVPDTGETSSNVFYRISLTVRDSEGLTHTVTRDVLPRKARITLASNPSGLTLRLDGRDVVTPHAFTGVAGIRRTLAAVPRQTLGNTTWEFHQWSDSGAATHVVRTPSDSAVFTATFREPPVSTGIRPENISR
jgi:glucose/arabinose dehydrogenase